MQSKGTKKERNACKKYQAATAQQRVPVSCSDFQTWSTRSVTSFIQLQLFYSVHAWVCTVKYGPIEGYLAKWEWPLYVTSFMTNGDGWLWKDRPHRQWTSGFPRLLIYSFNSSCSIQVLMKTSVQSIYSKSPGKDMSQICFPFCKAANWNPHDENSNKRGCCKLIFWLTIATKPHVADGLLRSANT